MVRVFVGIGSNTEAERHIRLGLQQLQDNFGELTVSTVYESEAIGFDGDNFLNLVVGFDTELSLQQLIADLHRIEDAHGRVRGSPRFSGRTLDLDILLFGDFVSADPGIDVPRQDIEKYAFVLCPLAEIAGRIRHPRSGQLIADMWAQFDSGGQLLWPKTFNWNGTGNDEI